MKIISQINKFLTIAKINFFLNRNGIRNYTINEDFTVSVIGSVILANLGLSEIPCKFDSVSGDFDCSYNNLHSLKNCPDFVESDKYFYNKCFCLFK